MIICLHLAGEAKQSSQHRNPHYLHLHLHLQVVMYTSVHVVVAFPQIGGAGPLSTSLSPLLYKTDVAVMAAAVLSSCVPCTTHAAVCRLRYARLGIV